MARGIPARRRTPRATACRLARPRADRRRRRASSGGAGSARRARHRRRLALVGDRQGAGPRCRARALLHCPGRPPFSSSRAIRCSTSCSGCATRRTASPSARTGPGARKAIGVNPLDEIAGIGPHAQAGAAAAISARPRRCRRAGLADLERWTASAEASRKRSMTISMPRLENDATRDRRVRRCPGRQRMPLHAEPAQSP